jgi:hypothetical protein
MVMSMQPLLFIVLILCVAGYLLTRYIYLNGHVCSGIASTLIFFFMFAAVLLVFFLAAPFNLKSGLLAITSATVIAVFSVYGTQRTKAIVARRRSKPNK